MPIKELPKDLIEKIAAGEVVERPVSVVKELVENAIDAGATHIEVLLSKAGTEKIEVRDNGDGMNEDDLALSIKAHATSKISSEDDLFAIHTLGFRGEALASIGAVSKLTIKTKQQDDVAGKQIQVTGGIPTKVEPTAATQGTTITVSDLFYNVPARQKFLKTQSTELQLIISLLTQLVFSHPEISFKLSHNGSILIDSKGSETDVDKLKDIYGKTVASQSLVVSHSHDGIDINGVVVKPSQVRSDKKGLSFFVNGRFVKNSNFVRAVLDGYDTLLMIGKYPICVLHITVDPKEIDVNVHPRKDIIKIENELEFLATITRAVSESFMQSSLMRDVTSSSIRTQTQSQSQSQLQSDEVDEEQSPSFESVKPKVYVAQTGASSQRTPISEVAEVKQAYIHTLNQSVLEKTPSVREDTKKELSVRYIGLLQKTFALCEDDQGLVMVDFHAAHERWNYERFMDQLYNKTVQTQTLLQPLVLEVSPDQKHIVEKQKELLSKWGFDVDTFGENEFILRTIPTILGRTIDVDYFFTLLSDIEKEMVKNSLETMQQKIITSMSCKASDRAGDDISSERAKELIHFALQSKMKYACPHGRPTFVRITKMELEKMFKRRV